MWFFNTTRKTQKMSLFDTHIVLTNTHYSTKLNRISEKNAVCGKNGCACNMVLL